MDGQKRRATFRLCQNPCELRYKEEQIEKDKKDGIKAEARFTTVNDLFELWIVLKRGLKNNTFENYKYMYETFVRPSLR